MNRFPRLVGRTRSITVLSSVAALGSITIVVGSAAFAQGAFAGQLFALMPESPALMAHSSQGYLGIEMRDIDNDRASSLKLKDATGAEIIVVDHDAPAGKVGLRVHDVIVQMNGQQVQGVEQLRRMLRETPPGRSVTLLISRDGQQQTINVQLADRAKIEQDAWTQIHTVPDPDGDDSTYALVAPSGHGAGNSFFGSLTFGSPSLGVELDPLGTQLADYFGVKDGLGLLVKRVAENSPASSAGLKAGDVITKVNGEVVNDARSLARRISTLSPGASVKLTLVRGGKEEVVTITLGEMPKERQANAGTQERELNGGDVPKLGLSLAPANQVAGSSGEGVVVTQVDPDGPAAERGFKTGDIILDVGGATVSTPSEVKKALADAKGAGKKTVLMRVKSEGGTRFVALPIGNA